jgi:hypothetical protein
MSGLLSRAVLSQLGLHGCHYLADTEHRHKNMPARPICMCHTLLVFICCDGAPTAAQLGASTALSRTCLLPHPAREQTFCWPSDKFCAERCASYRTPYRIRRMPSPPRVAYDRARATWEKKDSYITCTSSDCRIRQRSCAYSPPFVKLILLRRRSLCRHLASRFLATRLGWGRQSNHLARWRCSRDVRSRPLREVAEFLVSARSHSKCTACARRLWCNTQGCLHYRPLVQVKSGEFG